MFQSLNAWIIYIFFPTAMMLIGLWAAKNLYEKIGAAACAAYYLFRLAFIVSLWVITRRVPMDVQVWAAHAEWMVDEGLFPVSGFHTAYHLVFNLILFLAYSIWHSPYSIMLAFNMFEVMSIPIMYLGFREAFGEKNAKRVVILFVTSPIVWICNIAGQDEPIIIFFTAFIFWALVKSKSLFAAIAAFLCFASTKVLAPVYFGTIMALGRIKGLVSLAAVLIMYWVMALAIGINPFDYRSQIGPGAPVVDLSMAGYVRGSIWYYLQNTPKIIQFIVLFISWMVTVLVFIKALWSSALQQSERILVVCAMTTLVALEFFAFYRVCYFPYMLPFLPFAFATFLSLELPARLRNFIVSAFACWIAVLTHKEDGNRWMDMAGYTVDFLVYAGYLTFAIVVVTGTRRYLTSPWCGIKVVLRSLRRKTVWD